MIAQSKLAPKHSQYLDHDLEQYFSQLRKFESTSDMESSKIYERIRPEVDRILNTVVRENFASPSSFSAKRIPAVAWNIERGSRFEGIVDALQNHPDIRDKDLLLLTELDYGMARSGNRF